jgi:hypothetical protein
MLSCKYKEWTLRPVTILSSALPPHPSVVLALIEPFSDRKYPIMHSSKFLLILAAFSDRLLASPVQSRPDLDPPSNPNYGPVPGESLLYNEYDGKAAPFPGNISSPIAATTEGPPGPDDELFQNLLSAEWAIFNFYQQGVEAFNESSFTALGHPNTTYQRIFEIRDNEAGHLRIFQDRFSTPQNPRRVTLEEPLQD